MGSKNYIKSVRFVALFAGLMIGFTANMYGQTQLKNNELDAATREQKNVASEKAARSLFTALQQDNTAAIEPFIPTKEMYKDIISHYPYGSERERETAFARLDKEFGTRESEVKANYVLLNAQAKQSGIALNACKVKAYQMSLKNDETLRGGRAVVQVNAPEGQTLNLRIEGFYEYNNQWYVFNKMLWK